MIRMVIVIVRGVRAWHGGEGSRKTSRLVRPNPHSAVTLAAAHG